MYILTDGKNYVMKNPLQEGRYISTTSSVDASDFTYKQARTLLQNKKSAIKWIRTYYMVDKDTGNREETNVNYHGNGGVYCEEKDIEFDYSVIENIKSEVTNIIGLAAWDINQLKSFNSVLSSGLSYYDSAISDIRHARLDKRPPAHIRTKIDGIINDLEEKRRDIKQTMNYVDVLMRAITQQWTIGKIKAELSAAKYVSYKGRTKYYDMVVEMLG